MSPRLKRLSGRDVIRALGTFGFKVVNTRGSHAKLRRIAPDGSRHVLTLPLHDELAAGTLHAIYRQAPRYIPADELRRHFFHRLNSRGPAKAGPYIPTSSPASAPP